MLEGMNHFFEIILDRISDSFASVYVVIRTFLSSIAKDSSTICVVLPDHAAAIMNLFTIRPIYSLGNIRRKNYSLFA